MRIKGLLPSLRFQSVTVLMIGVLVGALLAVGFGRALAARNPTCLVSAAPGFAICIIDEDPGSGTSTTRLSATGTPFRHLIYAEDVPQAWGPWTWYDQTTHVVFKQPSWDWTQTVRHQVDNNDSGGANGMYDTIIV